MDTLLRRSLPVIIVLTALLAGAADAQVTEARVRVDGLACPFCAYGLEKKLNGISGVGKIEINVKEGTATLIAGPGASVDIEALEEAVSKAGFTPRGIHVTARGVVKTQNDRPVFAVAGTDILFLFERNQQFTDLLAQAPGPATQVQVAGNLLIASAENHTGHPYSIAMEGFKVLQ